MKRYATHTLRRMMGYKNPLVDRFASGSFGRDAIRGREQQLIDFYGGIGSPMVGNFIRGVSRSNRRGIILSSNVGY